MLDTRPICSAAGGAGVAHGLGDTKNFEEEVEVEVEADAALCEANEVVGGVISNGLEVVSFSLVCLGAGVAHGDGDTAKEARVGGGVTDRSGVLKGSLEGGRSMEKGKLKSGCVSSKNVFKLKRKGEKNNNKKKREREREITCIGDNHAILINTKS